MTGEPLPVSVRSFLDRWFLAAVVVGLALAAGGGYVAYDAHVDGAETVVEERTAGTWTVDSEFEHAATVERETSVFSAGERLVGRPLYFTTVAPGLEGTYTITHDNTDGESAVATVDLSWAVRSVEEIDDLEVVHWEQRALLDRLDAVEIADSDSVATTVEVNVTEMLARIEEVEEELGANPGEAEVVLVAETTVETSVAGETLRDERTDRITIRPDEAVYRVTAAVEDQRSFDTTEQVTRTVEPSVLARYGGPLVAALGLLWVAGLGIARWHDALDVTDHERERYEFETAREDFDEWISRAQLPDVTDRTTVRAASFADLVNIAIDSDRRVIEDDGRYAVLVDDVVYTYEVPTATAEEPLTPAPPTGAPDVTGTDTGDERSEPQQSDGGDAPDDTPK